MESVTGPAIIFFVAFFFKSTFLSLCVSEIFRNPSIPRRPKSSSMFASQRDLIDLLRLIVAIVKDKEIKIDLIIAR